MLCLLQLQHLGYNLVDCRAQTTAHIKCHMPAPQLRLPPCSKVCTRPAEASMWPTAIRFVCLKAGHNEPWRAERMGSNDASCHVQLAKLAYRSCVWEDYSVAIKFHLLRGSLQVGICSSKPSGWGRDRWESRLLGTRQSAE